MWETRPAIYRTTVFVVVTYFLEDVVVIKILFLQAEGWMGCTCADWDRAWFDQFMAGERIALYQSGTLGE